MRSFLHDRRFGLPGGLLAGVLLVLIGWTGCAPSDELASNGATPAAREAAEAAEAAIRQVMAAQVEAWNAGNLEGFMQGYAQTDSLRFASGGSVRRGWQEALAGYRRGYPDRAAMGTLAFDSLDVRVLSDRYALVFGRWRLQRADDASRDDAPHGLFTLLFERRRADGRGAGPPAWRIIHDHTSAD